MPAVRRNNKAGSQPALLPTKLSPLLFSGAEGTDELVTNANTVVCTRNLRSIFTEKSTFDGEETIGTIANGFHFSYRS